jgi:4-amino-4-deoxy-L-arabinose transferase-like glycosyltransferase
MSQAHDAAGLRSGRLADSRWGPILVGALFIAAVVAVNPLRECPVRDDWAYAETVQHLLNTHEYRLNAWLSANCPFQTMWGSAFCLVLGNSFQALRISTVVLALAGLAAFRGLAIENGLSRSAATLLMLMVATSSLFFKLSLTYLTDVPFVSTMMIALWLYSRALRRPTVLAWTAAALGGAAAILTRQFGAALVPAILAVWLFHPRGAVRSKHYLVGLSLPVLATAWQLNQGWSHSNWAAAFLLLRQRMFVWNGGVLKDLPWRPSVVAEYQALWLAPLVFLAGIAVFAGRRPFQRGDEPPARWGAFLSWLGWLVLFTGAAIYGWKVIRYGYSGPIRGSHALVPFVPHCYDILEVVPEWFRWAVTLLMVAGGALFARIAAARLVEATRGRLAPAELLLDFTALFSCGLTLIFVQFVDQYFLVYLPCAAIVVAKSVEDLLLRWRGVVAVCCMLLLVGAAGWTREDLAKDEAMWTLAERLRVEGVPADRIFSDWKWLFYWEFENYVRAGHATPETSYNDLFGGWMKQQQEAAEFWIVRELKPPPGETWKVVAEAHYFSLYSRGRQTFYAIRRNRFLSKSRPGALREPSGS